MLFRIVIGAGLFALGYYLGREEGRAKPIRDALHELREADGGKAPQLATATSSQSEETATSNVAHDKPQPHR